jgi:hypothetical protein
MIFQNVGEIPWFSCIGVNAPKVRGTPRATVSKKWIQLMYHSGNEFDSNSQMWVNCIGYVIAGKFLE